MFVSSEQPDTEVDGACISSGWAGEHRLKILLGGSDSSDNGSNSSDVVW